MVNRKSFDRSNTMRHNALEVEKTKIIFQFVLMLTASVLCGIFFTRLLSYEFLNSTLINVSRHFNAPFRGCGSFDEILSKYLEFCGCDIVCLTLLLLFSFSFINYIISDLVLIFSGFKFGMSIAVIWYFSFARIGFGNSFTFLILRSIALVVILIYSYRMALYSLDIRKFSDNGRVVLNKKHLLSILLFTVNILGLIFIINGLYCLLIYIF